ncbi:MAG: hypothetical protein IJ608_04655 [Lachnospiraceae bacterium]|nr:hypothetical protein [Lachnospiraceae bacterium]
MFEPEQYRKKFTIRKKPGEKTKYYNNRIVLALKNIVRRYPALAPVADYMEPVPVKEKIGLCIATDGKHLFFSAPSADEEKYDIGRFGIMTLLEIRILHIILHGILGHFSECAVWSCIRMMSLSYSQCI